MGLADRPGATASRADRGSACSRGGRVRVAAARTLGLGAARRLEDAFNDALDGGAGAVLIDLSTVAVADPRVLHTLLRIADQAHSVAVEYRLSAAIEQLLELAGVRHHLPSESRPARPVSRRRRRRGALRQHVG